MTTVPVRSPITNAWGEVRARKLDAQHIPVFVGKEGQAFNHQAQLAYDGVRLYATWSSGARDEEAAGQQVVVSYSDDHGLTWTLPNVLAPSRPGRYASSVVVSSGIHVHDDALTAFYGEWERWEADRDSAREAARGVGGHCFDVRTEARVSRDKGVTWSEPRLVLARQFGFMPPMPTKSGRLILPGHLTFGYTDDPAGLQGWRRAMIPGLPEDYVDDWYSHAKGAALLGTEHRFNEANFFESEDGIIHMMLRNENNIHMGVTESADDGETWSPPRLTSFTNSVSRSHFGRMPDGRFFCVSCPTPARTGATPTTRTPRTPVILSISSDGVRFDKHYIVGDEPQHSPRFPGYLKHGRYGYPFLKVAGDVAVMVYSVCKEDIFVARFSMSDLD